MKGTTHVKIGLAATAATATLTTAGIISLPFSLNMTTFALVAGGSVIGSLLPDNDTRRSTISKFMPISNKIVTTLADKGVKACYHRHFLHSVFCFPLIALWFAQSTMVLTRTLFLGIAIGSLLHILADALLSNTWILYPLIKKPVSFFHLKLEKHEKLYKGIEAVCSAFATITAFVLSGNFIITNI